MQSLLWLWRGLAPTLALQGLLSGAIEFFQNLENITVSQGETATLSCAIDGNVTRVAWLNRSSIMYAGRDKWSMDTRVSLREHGPGTYRIAIAPVVMYDEGLYTCSFQTEQQPHTLQLYLIVQVPAQITNISSDLSLNEGENVLLMCLAEGRPEPTVRWTRIQGEKLFPLSEGEYLEILGVSRHQAGDYQCHSNNGLGAGDTHRVHLTVNYAPQITDVRNVTVRDGHTAVLRCEAHSVPAADFQWYRAEKRLSGGVEGLRIQKDRTRSLLMFLNVSRTSYGNYTCSASNRLGGMNASMFLQGTSSSHGARPTPSMCFSLCLVVLGYLVTFGHQ